MDDAWLLKQFPALSDEGGMAYVVGSFDIIAQCSVELLNGFSDGQWHNNPPIIWVAIASPRAIGNLLRNLIPRQSPFRKTCRRTNTLRLVIVLLRRPNAS